MNLNNRKKELMSRRSSHGGPTHKGCVGSIIQPWLSISTRIVIFISYKHCIVLGLLLMVQIIKYL